jgi:internalin A
MPDLALRLIAENISSRATSLDLGNCGLKKIPAIVNDLVWLQHLSLASEWFEWEGATWHKKESRNGGRKNRLADLAPLAHLTGLRTLYLSGALGVTDLAPLAHLTTLQILALEDTPVTDVTPLANLTALQAISLSGTKVSDLAPLTHLTSLQRLDLTRTRVTDLAPLACMTSLQTLYFQATKITDLLPLSNLTALQWLDFGDTQITDLAPLANLTALKTLNLASTVTDLTPLANLTALETLYASPGKKIGDVAPLAHLKDLDTLVLRETRVSDLAPLAGLTALRNLFLPGAPVTDLTPLSNLTALRALDLSGTKVSDLAPLTHLRGLKTLGLRNTQVNDLAPLTEFIRGGIPVIWAGGGETHGIYVLDCPLTNPPSVIAAQGNDAILNYFTERAQDEVDHLYEAKMLILGEGGAGKTSLLRRLYNPGDALPTEQETTRGIEIHKHEFKMKNGRTFRLNVWDFGGQQIYHATHQFFLTHRSLYVLVDDTRKDHNSVSDEGFKYWLELIEVFGGHSPTLIFQNEKGDRSKSIDFGGIKKRYDNVKDLYAGNLDRRNAVRKLREGIEFYAANLSHVGDELPSRWIKVREEIEALAASKPYISVEKYFEIYSGRIVRDEAKALRLSRYLHDLGVFLHFQDDPLLGRTVILRNEWATNAAFRILDDEEIRKRMGRFNRDDCARLWKDSEYAQMHPELLALMQNFELCYELRDSGQTSWLAPQLLPPAKPEGLGNWAGPKDLILRYKYEFLPKGIISRLTVRLHRFVKDPEKAWTTGVIFERDHAAAMVEILPKGNEIELRARGPEHKALLSVIAADLDALNDSFKGLRDKVDKHIPCNCKVCRLSSMPQFFEQKALVRRKEHGILKVQCEISFEDVDVIEVLDGIKTGRPPDWANDDSGTEPKWSRGVISREIRIFLASSSELREDRDLFDLHFRRENDRLRKQGTYLQIVRWEYFLDAMSETRLQDEYNKEVRACDIFVSLFFTKTGKFTEEEFDVAHSQFKSTGKPLIYTYFKNADIKTGSAREDDLTSLWKFQKKLENLNHFYTKYDNTDHLLLQFRGQLDLVINKDVMGQTK